MLHVSHVLKKNVTFLASSVLKYSKCLRFKILKIHFYRCFYDLTDDMTQLMLIFCHLSEFFSLEYKTYLKGFFFCILATWHEVFSIRFAWNVTWSSIRNDLPIRSWLYSQGKTKFLLKKTIYKVCLKAFNFIFV